LGRRHARADGGSLAWPHQARHGQEPDVLGPRLAADAGRHRRRSERRRVDQRAYLEGTSEKAAREVFFYYTGSQPSAVRYKNWKLYYTMVPDTATGGLYGATTYHWTQIANIKRDPFEQTVGPDAKSLLGYAGSLGSASTAYLYDWNMLPIGQLLWEKELMSYKEFPPMQAPETYNLDGILKAMQQAGHQSE